MSTLPSNGSRSAGRAHPRMRTAALRYSSSMTRTIAPIEGGEGGEADDERFLGRDRLGRGHGEVDELDLALGPIRPSGRERGDLVGQRVRQSSRHLGARVLDADRQESRGVVGRDAARQRRGPSGVIVDAGLGDGRVEQRRRRHQLRIGLDEGARRPPGSRDPCCTGRRAAVSPPRTSAGSATRRRSRTRRRPMSPPAASTTTVARPRGSRSVPLDPLGNTLARAGLIAPRIPVQDANRTRWPMTRCARAPSVLGRARRVQRRASR